MARVIVPSPYRREAPKTPIATRAAWMTPARRLHGPSGATSAMIPPSPLLSARRTTDRYLIEITTMSDHTIIDKTP